MPKSKPQPPIAAPIVRALLRLHKARQKAVHAGENLWNHAVAIENLTNAGLSREHLTWMDQMGWIELGYEVGDPTQGRRVFAKSVRTANSVSWRAILTSAGLVALRNSNLADHLSETAEPPNGKRNGKTNGHAADNNGMPITPGLPMNGANGRSRTANRVALPKWDARTRELRLGKLIVKQLRCSAPNQILILSTFQEEGWPKAIDDPLPPNHEGDSRRRLSDTIKALNRNQVTPLLRFRSNGSGEVVTWERVVRSRSNSKRKGSPQETGNSR